MTTPSGPSREYEERRLAQQRRNRKLVRLFTGIFGILLVLISLVQLASGGLGSSVRILWFVLLASVGGFALVFRGSQGRRWERMRARLASEVLESDPRAPVLYLRPFAADRKNQWYERRISQSIAGLGPVITVGRPEEKIPATPYIAREYLEDDQWRDRVVDLIGRARLVITQIGMSEGLRWELGQVLHLARPDQLLLCLGPNRFPQLTGGEEASSRYQRFRKQFGPLFPKGLPAEAGGSGFIAFGSDWTPIPSSELAGNGKVDHPLAPQLQRLYQQLG